MAPLARSRYFRISVTDCCNMTCAFCHNEGQGPVSKGVSAVLDVESISWVAGIAFDEGFRKFKLTGGEPLIRPDICEVVSALRAIGIQDLSIITNGSLLSRMAAPLRVAGLERVNVSLHSLDPARFQSEFGSGGSFVQKIVTGVDAAISVGFTDMKINCVYGGPHPDRDLDTLLAFVAERRLTLVLLPELPFGTAAMSKRVSLDDLHELLSRRGIQKEEVVVDAEGLRKRLITMKNGAQVLLRLDELGERHPYAACSACPQLADCREGIFPVRLTSKGALRPCLNNGLPEINLHHAIKTRNDVEIRLAIRNLDAN